MIWKVAHKWDANFQKKKKNWNSISILRESSSYRTNTAHGFDRAWNGIWNRTDRIQVEVRMAINDKKKNQTWYRNKKINIKTWASSV